MDTSIVISTSKDRLTRQSAGVLIERLVMLMDHEPTWAEDVVDLCLGKPATLEDAVQYTIDLVNDDAPEGYWYYLTADCNLALTTDFED